MFIDHGNGAPEPFNEELAVTSGLNQLLLLYPGGIAKADDSKLKFEQLLQTGVGNSGTVPAPMLQRFDRQRPSPNKRGLPRDARPRTATSWPPRSPARRPRTTPRWPPPRLDDERDPADDAERRRRPPARSRRRRT